MLKRKSQKQKVFALAWKNARLAANFHGGKPQEYFGECLKLAYRGIELDMPQPAQTTFTPSLFWAVVLFLATAVCIIGAAGNIDPVNMIGLLFIACVTGFFSWVHWTAHTDASQEAQRHNQRQHFNRLVMKF